MRSCFLIGAICLLAAGCQDRRVLVIDRAEFINTGPHADGTPLQVDIVSLDSDDLEHPANLALQPGQRVTNKQWFAQRPTADANTNTMSRFVVPAEKIVAFYDRGELPGLKGGEALQGAHYDARGSSRQFALADTATLAKKGAIPANARTVAVPKDFLSSKRVIYVFAKFVGSDRGVLDNTTPAYVPKGTRGKRINVMVSGQSVTATTSP